MGRKESFTKLKYQEKLLHEINRLLRKDFRDPRLQFVSATHVELNVDYSVAKVYWDTFDSSSKDEIEKAIKSIAGRMRTEIAKNSNLRHTPSLEFIYNSQFEDAMKIDELLKKESGENKTS